MSEEGRMLLDAGDTHRGLRMARRALGVALNMYGYRLHLVSFILGKGWEGAQITRPLHGVFRGP